MRKLESGALAGLPGILGLGGGGGQSDDTIFDDDTLQQALVVNGHIRRRRANLTTEGVFFTEVKHTHSAIAAETVTSTLAPYSAAAGAASPWPRDASGKVPEIFDIWLLAVRAFSGAVGNFTSARMMLQPSATSGFHPQLTPTLGAGSAAAAVAGQLAVQIGVFDSEIDLGDLGVELHLEDVSLLKPPFRVPRGCEFRFDSRTAAAGANTYSFRLMLGVYPASMGQDVFPGAL